jgi:nitronate monooxygenase
MSTGAAKLVWFFKRENHNIFTIRSSKLNHMSTKNKSHDHSRRSFIRKAAASGIGLSLGTLGVYKDPLLNESEEIPVLHEMTKKLMAMFNLKYPIFQAPTGGAAWDTLAIAVSNAGAMGGLPLSETSPEVAYDIVTKVKAGTKRSFYINYILNFELVSLDKALEAGAQAVEFSWGVPDEKMISKISSAGAKFGIQVTSMQGAKTAMALNPDFLFCQGSEAGGHVQAHQPLLKVLSAVLKVTKDTPVVAAGGITTGHDIRKLLAAGAAGVSMGTRFVATKESSAHPEYKNAMVQANEDNTVLTVCFDKGWPNALQRVLRNNTFNTWEAEGCPPSGKRPGEKDIIVTRADGSGIERYGYNTPREVHKGKILEMALYAGQGVKNINDIPSASDLIVRLWKEFENKK